MSRPRLSAADWVEAALAALAQGGVAAVAVEPVAARLGTTKGSFYWHFANRDALLQAVLDRWEDVGTEQVIRDVETDKDPAVQLRRLFERTVLRVPAATADGALLADADHPAVAAALERVARRRLSWLQDGYAALGADPPEARSRALLAYSAWLGLLALRRTAPAELDGPAVLDGLLPLLSIPRRG